MVNYPRHIFRPVVLLLVFLVSYSVYATGVLDPTFGTGGKVFFNFGGGSNDFAGASIFQPDGKIVIVGRSGPPGQGGAFDDFGVARLNPDGSFDNTFGTNGRVTTDFGRPDGASAVAIQPDGKIVVGGSSDQRYAIARYNANGSLDTGFGTGGKIIYDHTDSTGEGIYKVFVLGSGKIMVVGSWAGPISSPPAQIALVRFTAGGTLDTGFGTGGRFLLFFPRYTYINGAAIQPDGKILLTGEMAPRVVGCVVTKTNPCETTQSVILRYSPEMLPDRKFGRSSGKDLTRLGDYLQRIYDITLQSDGRILLTGDLFIKRYSSNGRFETVFDPAPFQFGNLRVVRLGQRTDGKVVGCGQVSSGHGDDDLALALYTSDGHLVGTDRQDFFAANDYCGSILTPADGKFYVIGSTQIASQSSYKAFIARYTDITP